MDVSSRYGVGASSSWNSHGEPLSRIDLSMCHFRQICGRVWLIQTDLRRCKLSVENTTLYPVMSNWLNIRDVAPVWKILIFNTNPLLEMEGNKKDDLDNLGDYEDQEHVLPEEDNKQK